MQISQQWGEKLSRTYWVCTKKKYLNSAFLKVQITSRGLNEIILSLCVFVCMRAGMFIRKLCSIQLSWEWLWEDFREAKDSIIFKISILNLMSLTWLLIFLLFHSMSWSSSWMFFPPIFFHLNKTKTMRFSLKRIL